MKAKLIKTQEGYTLNDVEGNPIGQTFGKFKGKKLSLKNCQAIELGYDLDELVLDYEKENEEHIQVDERQRQSFIKGFQKALEILGDKKFSEDDVNLAFVLGKNKDESRINKLINSRLQQTEWDVEIVMDVCGDKVYVVAEPLLDADGCLILKRI